MTSAFNRVFRLLAKIALTFAAFWYVAHDVDFAHLRDMVQRQQHALLTAAIVFVIIQASLGALRWRLILEALAGAGQHLLSAAEAIRIYYISLFFSCCLPGMVGGDVVRVWLARSTSAPLPLIIHSVIIDRLIALAALALMVLVTLPMLGGYAGFPAAPIIGLAIVLAAIGLWFLFHLDRLLGRFSHVRLVRWLLYFAGSLRLLLTHRSVSIQSLLYAVVAHSCYCIAAFVLAQSLGIELSLLQSLVLIPPVLLAMMLPISIGGWGVREAGMVAMLSLIGIPSAPALMLSVQLGLLIILISLPGGVLWLFRRKQAPAQAAMAKP